MAIKGKVIEVTGSDIRFAAYIVPILFAAYFWLMSTFATAADVSQMKQDYRLEKLWQMEEQALYIEDMLEDKEAKKADKKKLKRLQATIRQLRTELGIKQSTK